MESMTPRRVKVLRRSFPASDSTRFAFCTMSVVSSFVPRSPPGIYPPGSLPLALSRHGHGASRALLSRLAGRIEQSDRGDSQAGAGRATLESRSSEAVVLENFRM